jgi:DNA-binding GntR family transcriptional regulator
MSEPMDTPKSEPRRLNELIYYVLREHLLDESFPPGLVFGEAAVARAFGSSRIPAAAALQRLKSDGLLKGFKGRGLIAAHANGAPLMRAELTEVGLRLPAAVANSLEVRNHHGRIYPQVEHAIAASLSYGRFLVNESALAEHYGVSRTVAHEVLTRLERTGLITQEGNQRWYTGPLTAKDLREHFEVRWLLEPVALGQSMDALDRSDVMRRRAHLESAIGLKLTPLRVERLETELHVHTVLARANSRIVEAVRRSQLLVIPTHSTFALQPHIAEVGRTLEEHLEIFDLILTGKKKAAMQALELHVKRALEPNIERIKRIARLPTNVVPPFLLRVDASNPSARVKRQAMS